MTGMVTILAICDAEADFRGVQALVDRLLIERTWMADFASTVDDQPTAHTLDTVRQWSGFGDENVEFSTPAQLKRVARDKKLTVHARGRGAEFLTARKAIKLAALRTPRPDALVIVRDTENHPGRQRALEDAAAEADNPSGHDERVHVLVGVQHPMREAWVLAAWHPTSEADRAELLSIKQQLGFDPTTKPHRLRSKNPTYARHPKSVVARLQIEDLETQIDLLWTTSWEALKRRGEQVGTKAFVEQVEGWTDTMNRPG